jgi:hypothetical protein
MTRHPLLGAVALAGGLTFVSAVPAAANHGPYCVSSPEQVIWCSPRTEDADPGSVCLATDDSWCSPTASQVVHGNPSTDLPGAICVYPYDGGWCTPDLDDHVTQFCIYPYDGGWCIPWVELPPL